MHRQPQLIGCCRHPSESSQDARKGDGPFTVFAPTDQAFTDAGIDLAALDTPDGVATLSEILLSHVVASSVPASDVSGHDRRNGQRPRLGVHGW